MDGYVSGSSFRSVALTGGRWIALEGVVAQLLQLGTIAALGRLLLPEDFGIVAAVAVTNSLFGLATQFGFAASIIQKMDLSARSLTTTFWTSTGIGVIAWTLAAALSTQIAESFGQPGIAQYIAVGTFAIPLGAIASVPIALVQRELRFFSYGSLQLLKAASYSAIAIVLAARPGVGAWAVVWASVLSTLIFAVAAFITSRWMPSLAWDRTSAVGDIRFNVGFLAITLLAFANKNVDYWFVSRVNGSAALGVYYIAYVVPNILRQRLTGAAQRTLYPIFSRISFDRQRSARAYVKATRLLFHIAAPAMIGYALVADLAVPLVLGPAWSDASRASSVLAIAGLFTVPVPLTISLLLAEGRPSVAALISGMRLVILLIALSVAAAIASSVVFIAMAVLVASAVGGLVSVYVAYRRVRFSPLDILSGIASALAASLAMASVVYGLRFVVGDDLLDWGELVILIAAGVVSYLGVLRLVDRQAFEHGVRDIKMLVLGH